jgi:hypothetical protein
MNYLKDFLEKYDTEPVPGGGVLSVLSVPHVGPYTPSDASPEGDPEGVNAPIHITDKTNFDHVTDKADNRHVEEQNAPGGLTDKTNKTAQSDHLQMLTTWVHAVYGSRTYPHPTGRRSSIEDGLAIARALDTLDALAAADHDTNLWFTAPLTFKQAADLIRQRQFYRAYEVLDGLSRLAVGGKRTGRR